MGARTTARPCVRPMGMTRARRYAATTRGRRSPPSAGWISTGRRACSTPSCCVPASSTAAAATSWRAWPGAARSGLLLVLGSPTMLLPLVHVRDVAEAVVRTLRLARAPAAPLDLVGPRPPTQAEWLARRRATGDERLVPLYLPVARLLRMLTALPGPARPLRLPPRLGDAVGALRRRCGDTRARLAPGFSARPGARATRRVPRRPRRHHVRRRGRPAMTARALGAAYQRQSAPAPHAPVAAGRRGPRHGCPSTGRRSATRRSPRSSTACARAGSPPAPRRRSSSTRSPPAWACPTRWRSAPAPPRSTSPCACSVSVPATT